MSALHALNAARDAGVRIGVDGDALTRDADAAPPEAMLNLLSRHKAEVIALLRTGSGGGSGEDWRALYDERAAIAESDGGLPRASVEDRLNHDCPHYRKIHSGHHAPGRRRRWRRAAHQPIVLDVLPQDHR
jgi:hypothetical protein